MASGMQPEWPDARRRFSVLSALARSLKGPTTTRFQPPPEVRRLSKPSNARAARTDSACSVPLNEPHCTIQRCDAAFSAGFVFAVSCVLGWAAAGAYLPAFVPATDVAHPSTGYVTGLRHPRLVRWALERNHKPPAKVTNTATASTIISLEVPEPLFVFLPRLGLFLRRVPVERPRPT
ncbi:hypothetical protein COLO4_02446 [Corchorus olitorius]|uniref:Uncharacterized protein n=1 Tax=Corchorus olitorius TaxID=93759 RepID=A0A1R3L0Y4_9ROSI|nr:hypothetical protein COLO4_02446 [Corchorus olitorius]